MFNKRRIFACMAASIISAVAALPVSAQQVLPTQCAIGWVGGPEHVIQTFNAPDVKVYVDAAGSACNQTITNGNWVGANKYANWMRLGYIPVCTARVDNYVGVDIWAYPDVYSRMIADVGCNGFQDGGYFVEWW